MNKKTTAYERLKELSAQGETINASWSSGGKYTEWSQSVHAAIKRMFGDDSGHIRSLNSISYSPLMCSASTPNHVFDDCFMGGVKQALAVIRSVIQEFEDYELESADSETDKDSAEPAELGNRIFLVHGHDNEMKETVARFLEKISFEPVILHEQANAGATIIEKFERNTDVQYAIVLFSPDDVGNVKTKAKDLNDRARQNVVLELGYFLGKLGRSHVCPLVRGKMELPSDIHGVVYVPFDGESWKLHIIKELKHLGFAVDANAAF